MNQRFRAFAVPLALAATLSTLAGCQVPALTPGSAQQLAKQVASYASLGLKMLDDAGIETGIDKSMISKMLVGGKEVTATYDADGNLQVPVAEGGGEQLVEVVLSDGQKVKVPFQGKKGESFNAFLMSGYEEGELLAELGKPGQKPMDLFKGHSVEFEVGEPSLTNENAKAFYIGQFKTPRHSWFVDNGNLRLHASNLWVLMHAKGGPGQGQPMQGGQPMPGQPMAGQPMPGQPQPGQPMPGQPQPGQPQPQPPMFATTFELAQTQPQPGQPMPGQPQPGQPMPGQPMPGQPMAGQPQAGQAGGTDADRKVVLRVAAEIDGKIKVWAFTPKAGVRLPGPPPPPVNGKPQFDNLPRLPKTEFDVETKEFASLEALEAAIGKAKGNFLPPPPPMHPMGPGGAQQPPPPGGQQPLRR